MKLRSTFLTSGSRFDITISTGPSATIGNITARLLEGRDIDEDERHHPYGIVVHPGTASERVIHPRVGLADADVHSGDTFALARVTDEASSDREQVATLHVVHGPDAGAAFPVSRGANSVGRGPDCAIRLTDPLVSKRHARLVVSDILEIVDDSSANGIQIAGRTIDRAIIRPDEHVVVGDTTLAVTLDVTVLDADRAHRRAVVFNRSPRVEPVFDGVEIEAPEPPEQVQSRRFPIITLIAPLLMAGIIFAVTRNPLSILFVALSPMMVVGSYAEQKYSNKRSLEAASETFDVALTDLRGRLDDATSREIAARLAERPGVFDTAQAVADQSPLMWTRRPDRAGFLSVRLGIGRAASRNSVTTPAMNRSIPALRRKLEELIARYESVGPVPIVADLRSVGSIGVAGPAPLGSRLRNMVLSQIVGLHSPADVVVTAVASTPTDALDWIKWLPHAHSEHSPLDCTHLASDSTDATILIGAIEELIDDRLTRQPSGRDDGRPPTPAVVLVVDDDAPADRARLVQIAETGRDAGVYVIWGARRVADLPAACRAFISLTAVDAPASVGFADDGLTIDEVACELPTIDETTTLARRLAPMVDGGARALDDSDLPATVSFVALVGDDLVESSATIIETWRQNHSLPGHDVAAGARRTSLRALIGQSGAGPLHLDLRIHGPHALVGGTTGSGKSEFLQTWVIGMATMHSPNRVTFLLIDYKGGSAFGECVDLPHSVGLVTDLSPHLVRRALTSLDAEVRHREEILNRKKAKDLLELEARDDPDAPPSLVIVVDEFAALASDVPEFVEGVVNIAQRGRSLGLHLILATQRPAGVIKDNLRANTNLRIALRMADEGDSTDVIGVPTAATFDADRPGRAIVKTGPGRLVPFQAAYVGGRTSATAPLPDVEVSDLALGTGAVWPTRRRTVEPAGDGPSDLRRMVDAVRRAATDRELPTPRRPWLTELSDSYELEGLADEGDRSLVFGIADEPERQRQPRVSFHPDIDGNIAVYGTGGTGKSTTLRTLAIAASLAAGRDYPWQIYGLDFGGRGLQMLESLPTVGSIVVGDDGERVARTIRMLRSVVDDRAQRFAAVRAGTLDEYRRAISDSDDARLLLLVDGIGGFRSAYEGSLLNKLWETFQSIMSEGRSVGVHIAVSADRPAALPSGVASLIQRRVVLRLAGDNDYMSLGVPSDLLAADSPPGRALVDGREAQVAILGGRPGIAKEAAAVEAVAERLRTAGVPETAPIRSLPDLVTWHDLPATVAGRPTIGLGDEALSAVGLPNVATFLISGPTASGRTTALTTIARSVRECVPDRRMVLLGAPRSSLVDAIDWNEVAIGSADIAQLATRLAGEVDRDGDDSSWTIVIEAVGELLNSDADLPLQSFLKACRSHGHSVVAESETSTLVGSWPLLQLVKFSRAGLALQPDALDGDNLFKVSFPRMTRADFPRGRGLLVHNGSALRLQVAVTLPGSAPHSPDLDEYVR